MPRPSDASASTPPRAGVFASYVEGWRRVWRAPAVVLGAWAAALFVTAILVSVQPQLAETKADDFGALADSAADALTYDTLDLVGWLAYAPNPRDTSVPAHIVGQAAAYFVLWLFLSGGILDRLARGRRVGAGPFFAACGVFFLRFLRLSFVLAVLYWALLRTIGPWIDESLVAAAIAGLLIGLVLMTADFAKARAVVEDRRSMAGAFLASLRFLRRRPVRVLGLFALHVLVLAGLWYVWSLIPLADATWPSLLLSSTYLLLRLVLRMALLGAEIAFFQGELAHATYTAAPLPVWPDSPSAEAIDNFLRQQKP
jgi:hypothetical protein